MRGVVFDLDGTLLDTIGDICAAMNRTLGSDIPTSECIYFVGKGLSNALRCGLERIGRKVSEEEFKELDRRFQEDYANHPADSTRPYPCIPAMLKALFEAGIPAGVYSNKAHPVAVRLVKELLVQYPFTFIEGWGGRFPSKPCPDAVNAFKAESGVDEVLYIGDTLTDWNTGNNAGAKVGILTWGFRTRQDLLDAGIPASDLIDTPAQLKQFLGV